MLTQLHLATASGGHTLPPPAFLRELRVRLLELVEHNEDFRVLIAPEV